jgi:hypothetical protein
MRFGLATSVGVTALALVAAHAACLPTEECNAAGGSVTECETMFDVGAHVPGSAASLAGASVKFCRNGDCASATLGATSDAGVLASAALRGAAFSAQAQLSDENDGFTMVDISLALAASAPTLTDGDTYSVTIADAGGKTLLDVSRPVTYDVVQACRQTCRDYSMQVYPTSASGIACGDMACASGVTFLGAVTTSDTTVPFHVSLCRNGGCATDMGYTVGSDNALQGRLGGALTGEYGIQPLKDQTLDFQVVVHDDAAALRDGDMYALTITQGATTLASWSGLAPYQTTFPNGMACDAFPCRYASVEVH